MIDDEVQNIKNTQPQSMEKPNVKSYYAEDEKVELRFKYCHPRDVGMKRQKQLIFKARFYQHHLNLKSQGKKYELLHKTNRWLELNMDKLLPRGKSLEQGGPECPSSSHRDQKCLYE